MSVKPVSDVAREALSRHPLKLLTIIGRGPYEELAKIFATTLEDYARVSASVAPTVDDAAVNEPTPRSAVAEYNATVAPVEQSDATKDALQDKYEEGWHGAIAAIKTFGLEQIEAMEIDTAPALSAATQDEAYRAGLRRAAKEVCDTCDNEEKYGPAHKIAGSTRWWHGKESPWPCEAGGIHALLQSITPTTEEGAG